MVYLSLLCTLALLFSSDGEAATFGASNQTIQLMKHVSRRETPILPPPYLQLPVSVDSRLPLVDKQNFSPSRGAGQEPLPEHVWEVLLPNGPQTRPHSVSGVSVRTSCVREKMLVQVDKHLLGTGDPQSHVKLGTCQPSKSTRYYLHFEYNLGMCGTTRAIVNNQVVYSNTLQYDPPKLHGPIRRSAPFSLPVSCYYNRYQYSYKIGYKPMRHQAKFLLTQRNAQWERLFPSDQYVLRKTMYFEAEGPSMSQDQRLYVHMCYATPEKSHTSKPQFHVVENFGCMTESRDRRSRFIPYKNNVVRFSVDAFLFKGMTGQQLYMHCSMSVGCSVPTPTAKSCNYDTEAQRWVELYGKDSVCTCCDSNCSAASTDQDSKQHAVDGRNESETQKIPNEEDALQHNKNRNDTSAGDDREVTTLHPETIEVTKSGKVENTVEELEWPFGGGGVHWVEMEEEEEQVKGSAVVEEEEEEEEEVVTQSRTTFEEIFDFAK